MRKRAKIGVLVSKKTLTWKSCQIISKNLRGAYKAAFGTEIDWINCDQWKKPSDISGTAASIAQAQYEKIVFLDHTPHPGFLIRALERFLKGKKAPDFYFHIYGDFTRQTQEWLQIEPYLKGKRCLFLCGSTAQNNLVSKFVVGRASSVETIPFPVGATDQYFDLKERAYWRSRLGNVQKDDLVFLYTGRISSQKNVLLLAKEFIKLKKTILSGPRKKRRSIENAQLWIAGSFDDLGAPFFGQIEAPGAQKIKWENWARGLDDRSRQSLRLLGNCGRKKLRGVHCASDVFVSLSLYHDEDFGVSPVEALCCGTPAILSGWGGFNSLTGNNVKKLPVKLTARGLHISSENIQSAFLWAAKIQSTSSRRQRTADLYREQFSIPKTADLLIAMFKLHPRPFCGFTRTLTQHARRAYGPPLFPRGPEPGGLYNTVYEGYL